MPSSENLSDKIRKEIRKIQKQQPDNLPTFNSSKINKTLNPDTDKEAFSEQRKRYEEELDCINKNCIANSELKSATNLDNALIRINQITRSESGQQFKGLKGFIRKAARRIIVFALRDELEFQDEFRGIAMQILSELNHHLRLFAACQSDLNASIARYGQSVVPVIDEKVRYAYKTLNKIISENIELLVKRMDILHEGLDKRQTEVLTWLENTHKELREVSDQFVNLEKETYRALSLQHRKIDGLQGRESPLSTQRIQDIELTGYDYYLFEMQARGSEEAIRNDQRAYIDGFMNKSPVLDVGCGRGEFLELLQAAKIEARGIDINAEMVGICKEKGLDVIEGESISFLEKTPAETWGGIFAAQVVEHFPRNMLNRWLQAAFRTLKPDGVLCFETVNTASPFALIHHYYRDPTHQLPLHPETYKFLMEIHGFSDVSIQYRSPVPQSSKLTLEPVPDSITDDARSTLLSIVAALNRIQDYIYAPCDIAVRGVKPKDK